MSQHSLRQQRNVFLLFLGACFVALMCALPIVTAQTQQQMQNKQLAGQSAAGGASAAGSASAAVADQPGFEKADRNKDGVVDKSEAGVVPGLSANFERVDLNRDGKLDADEFAKGLQILQVRR